MAIIVVSNVAYGRYIREELEMAIRTMQHKMVKPTANMLRLVNLS